MPNWTSNQLVVLVPHENAAAFKSEVEGPAIWPSPSADVNCGGFGLQASNPPSAHEMIEFEREKWRIDEFLALPEVAFRPDWMPVSWLDIQYMRHRPRELNIRTVPFSVPRLMPWQNREEFDEYFPGVMQGPFWNVDPERRRQYNSGDLGLLRFCRERIGVKWPPAMIKIINEDTPSDSALTSIVFDYETPWSPIENLVEVLGPVLRKHKAKCLLLWSEDGAGTSGFDYVNPVDERYDSEDLGDTYLVELEDDDGDIYHETNDRALAKHAIKACKDQDFVGRL